MDSIFDFVHQTHPNAQIIWQCYDYPNFNDPCLDFTWDPYCDLWANHGYATPFEINRFMNYLTDYNDSVTQAYQKPYMHFFNNLGLMQWHYGQTKPLRYAPFGSYPPHSVPFPRGRLDYPSPHEAMGLGGVDTYHLGPGSFTVLADFYLRTYISNYLRRERDTTAHSQGADKDGWVTSGNQTGTGEIQLGKSVSTITKGIISFNTDFIPDDTTVTRASLFIRNKTIDKKFPLSDVFPNFFKLDIVKGSFGNDGVEATDFSAPASAYDIACVAGNLRGNEYTLRFDLHEDALKYINKTGTTQFRLEMSDENFIRFYNGDTAELEGPYLDLYYDTASVVGVINKKNTDQDLKLFPNPSKNEITIQLNKEWLLKKSTVTIYNTQGALITSNTIDKITSRDIKIDISKLAAGNYFISIENSDSKSVGTFVKLQE